MNRPLLSIIVPVYNAEKFLSPCVESILAQTYPHLEIILVDDGSTDASAKICEEYAKKDTHVRVIHQPNGGVSAARNTGLQAASGEYIGFVDADDAVCPTMYRALLEAIENTQSDLACCNYVTKQRHTPLSVPRPAQTGVQVYTDKTALFCLLATSKQFSGTVWNKLYRKRALRSARFNPRLGRAEDTQWLLQVLQGMHRAVCIPDYLYLHYRVSTSITHQAHFTHWLDEYGVWKEVTQAAARHAGQTAQQTCKTVWLTKAVVLLNILIFRDKTRQYQTLQQEIITLLKQNRALIKNMPQLNQRLFAYSIVYADAWVTRLARMPLINKAGARILRVHKYQL